MDNLKKNDMVQNMIQIQLIKNGMILNICLFLIIFFKYDFLIVIWKIKQNMKNHVRFVNK